MSLVIVGGHDRMHSEYKTICKKYKCRVKIFTQMPADFKSQIGSPDQLIVFTKTASHKMVITATREAERKNIPIIHFHNSSVNALENIMKTLC
ncbi:MAG: DUF2325 domain-containing protein [Cellulosilyticaceae bacterium]